MTDKIKKLFADSAKKAKRRGQKVGENSLLNIKLTNATDHYTICPFRSIDAEECPLCILDSLGEV